MTKGTALATPQRASLAAEGEPSQVGAVASVAGRDGFEQEVRVVPLALIDAGANPRSFFDPGEFAELVASVRALGVAQPVLLRPAGERFQIVAGERRVRAAREVYGVTGSIPALIRECSEQDAAALALVENTARADMSATEEAAAAQGLVLRLKGDREEAAARLGWTASKLTRRLALMRLEPEVRTALNERRILLGHAELLAAVEPAKQSGALAKIVAHSLSVAQVRDQVAAMSRELRAAVFDRTECASCPYNSSQQRGLFTEALASDGRCTRPPCFAAKTDAHLEGLRVELSERFPKVIVIRPESQEIPVPLVADGRGGVGAAQAQACRGCGSFGASVSALPGQVGAVDESVCFDPACNQLKVSAHLASLRKPLPAARGAAVPAVAGAEKQASGVSGTAPAGAPAGAAAKAAQHERPKADVSSVTSRVREYRDKAWRSMAARTAMVSPCTDRLLVALALSGDLRHADAHKLAEVLGSVLGAKRSFKTDGLAGWVDDAVALGDEHLSQMTRAVAASCMRHIDERALVAALVFLSVDESQFFTLDKAFLDLLTKSEIESAARDVGLAQAMGDKTFSQALALKRPELIERLLAVDGFQYAGAVPSVMRYPRPQAREVHKAAGAPAASGSPLLSTATQAESSPALDPASV